ncbi:TPA: EscS/YscS/HrcS family type III secretion system export apparatus protein [Escherichia fergusonii]|uniref:EscS/YscS/HrcS family type III secretion system export apparatus protein n=1 Tax=Escherichia fergusonii TaxID=564 RepID=UPI0015F7704D|nr:EscS/YscS/HrcS family type III secretion system export apparatus protein [Escherichia fergusonii]EHG5995782.1 EscS/YscS/HrcS family type III secretion system export apparatus protein [Escherichia fergusonii]MBA8502678.1 EscS/YscS/HrcS family type III secretion system export apparatus protein [Escherichia fergusonii]HAI1303485.1 EscS/YscS/HrcS family type III secretion system export apparatus protein [Escherichia fergusonii]HCO8232347.1 EscS/YscS/HrcS family type III secretion system export a
MNDIVFAGNKALYLVLLLVAAPIAVATIVGLLVGLIQTVTQLQEQTLPFGIKLISVSLCFFLMSGWYGEVILAFAQEMLRMALGR